MQVRNTIYGGANDKINDVSLAPIAHSRKWEIPTVVLMGLGGYYPITANMNRCVTRAQGVVRDGRFTQITWDLVHLGNFRRFELGFVFPKSRITRPKLLPTSLATPPGLQSPRQQKIQRDRDNCSSMKWHDCESGESPGAVLLAS